MIETTGTIDPTKTYPYEMVDGLPRLSYSALKAFMQSPAHFIAYKEKKDTEVNENFRFGKMFHHHVLQPEVFENKYQLIPEDAPKRPMEKQLNASYMVENYYTIPSDAPTCPTDKQMGAAYMTSDKPADKLKAQANIDARKFHDDLKKKNEGKILLTEADMKKRAELKHAKQWWDNFDATGKKVLYPNDVEVLAGMRTWIERSDAAGEIIMNATDFEKELFFKDEETGITMKVIIDIHDNKHGGTSELKTTGCAHPESFKWEIRKYNMPGQLAIYFDALRANGMKADEKRGRIIASEKKVPYACSVFEVGVEAIRKGRYEYREWLKIFKGWFLAGMPLKGYDFDAGINGTFIYDIEEHERV